MPPKPPPQALGMTRTRSGGQAEDQRQLVAVHVRRLRRRPDLDACRPPRAPCPPRARCTRAPRRSVSKVPDAVTADAASAASTSPRRRCPSTSTFPGAVLVQAGPRRVGQAGSPMPTMRQRRPFDRQVLVPDPGDRPPRRQRARAPPRRDSDVPVGEHRLVLARVVDAVPVRPGMSAAVSTRTRPGCPAVNAARSPTSNRAWRAASGRPAGRGRPSSNRSSAEGLAVPVTCGMPSSLRDARPRGRVATGASGFDGASQPPADLGRPVPAGRGGRHRLDDLRVPGAAAQDAAEPVEHLRLASAPAPAREVVRRHEHPGRAGAALRAAPARGTPPGSGARVPSGRASPSTVVDPASLDLADRHEAGADLLVVEPDRARPAVAGVAADLGAGQPQVVAQDVREAPRRSSVDAPRRAVH